MKTFEANGKTYYVNLEPLTAKRYAAWSMIMTTIFSGQIPQNFFKFVRGVYDHIGTGDNAQALLRDIGTMCYNKLKELHTAIDESGTPQAFKLCALFCNLEGEDTTQWSEQILETKVSDFMESKEPVDFFLTLRDDGLKYYAKRYLNTNQPNQQKVDNPKTKGLDTQ